jgi:PiT family inorganic phosphate transporter
VSFEVFVFLVALALAFDFMNGFHDAANSIATVVSTGVLKPHHAVAFAAFFNFAALFVFQLKVAAAVGKGIVDPSIVDHYVIFGALTGAIAWNFITWYYGIPSSSSHAIIGGLIGAVVAKVGTGGLLTPGIGKTLIFIIVSPTLGFILGGLLMLIVSWLFFRTPPSKVDRWFRRLQLVSAGYYSLGHGANDAQKTMGIIWLLMISGGFLAADAKRPPDWVILSCYAAMGLGTLFGGWRIVKTMGQRLTKLKPVGGFCAENGGAITLTIASLAGIPVSTTHTITGAIVGVGSARKLSAVRWGLAGNIVWAWILTIPCSAFMAAVAWYIGERYL